MGLVVAINTSSDNEDLLPDGLFTTNIWVKIATDSRIFITLAKSEMGQGVMTALPMLVAEELEVSWESISVVQANSPLADGYGNQTTGGSGSVRGSWESLRQAGALAKSLLLTAASRRWGIDESECYARLGSIYNKTNDLELGYGELAEDAATIPLPESVTLKQPKDFQLIGNPLPRSDIPLHVTGKAQYGTDYLLPGQLTAVVVHSPVFAAKPDSFNVSKAELVRGVQKIFEIESGIAIVAENYWSAIKAKEQLKINWKVAPEQRTNSETIRGDFINALEYKGIVAQKVGDVSAVLLAHNTKKLIADYELPFQAHVTMEPMSCTADFSDGKREVWAPTQSPRHAHEEVVKHGLSKATSFFEKLKRKLTNTSLDSIRVNTTLLGCGFGRRLQQDYVAEAVQISRSMNAPIRLVWPREEDMQHDYYRPANHNRISAILDDSGKPVTWQHKIAGPSISDYLWDELEPGKVDYLSIEGATDIPYDIANVEVEWVKVNTPVPIGMWRSVGHSQNAFVIESFIDELANYAKKDPLEYRLSLLNNAPKHKAVLKLCAEKAGWGKRLAKGHYCGLAVHKSYYTYVAHVVELSIEEHGRIKVHKITSAIDCGTVVNPDIVKAQIEGAIVFGLSATLKNSITIKNGRVEQSNFNDYPLLRFNEMPEVEVHFIQSDQPPTGVGEPGVPPVAPAVANAIFSATGKRIRKLPIKAADLN